MSLLSDLLTLFTPATMKTNASDAASAWDLAHKSAHPTLLASATIDLKVTSKQLIYAVPTGKRLVPVAIYIRSGSVAPTGNAAIDFGGDAVCSDWLTGFNPPSSANYVSDVFETRNVGHPTYAGGTQFGAKLTADTTATTVTADLFGYLV